MVIQIQNAVQQRRRVAHNEGGAHVLDNNANHRDVGPVPRQRQRLQNIRHQILQIILIPLCFLLSSVLVFYLLQYIKNINCSSFAIGEPRRDIKANENIAEMDFDYIETFANSLAKRYKKLINRTFYEKESIIMTNNDLDNLYYILKEGIVNNKYKNNITYLNFQFNQGSNVFKADISIHTENIENDGLRVTTRYSFDSYYIQNHCFLDVNWLK